MLPCRNRICSLQTFNRCVVLCLHKYYFIVGIDIVYFSLSSLVNSFINLFEIIVERYIPHKILIVRNVRFKSLVDS